MSEGETPKIYRMERKRMGIGSLAVVVETYKIKDW